MAAKALVTSSASVMGGGSCECCCSGLEWRMWESVCALSGVFQCWMCEFKESRIVGGGVFTVGCED